MFPWHERRRAATGKDCARNAHRQGRRTIASSTKSFEDAIRTGLRDAAQTTRGFNGAHVESMSVRCENGEIQEYRVNLKVAFGVER